MGWAVSFIASWIIFFVLVDYSTLKINIIGGILSAILATVVDYGGNALGLYSFNDLLIPWFLSSVYYIFGPVLVMGIIFMQLMPNKPKLQLVHILAMSLSFLAYEYLILKADYAVYIRWHLAASFLVNILTFCSMSWFASAIRGMIRDTR